MTYCNDPGGVALTLIRGDTLRALVEMTDANGQPVDVSTFEWASQLRDADDVVAATITVDETDASIGVVVLGIASDVSATLEPADYVFDVEATDEDDETRTLVTGRVRVKADVTRSVTP